MFFRKKPRKKIFLTNIHYHCFDLLNYWLDAVTFHAFVIQPLADYDTDVLQAAVADSRGKALSAGKKCLVQSAATWGMWMMQALKLLQDLPCASIVLLLCNAKV